MCLVIQSNTIVQYPTVKIRGEERMLALEDTFRNTSRGQQCWTGGQVETQPVFRDMGVSSAKILLCSCWWSWWGEIFPVSSSIFLAWGWRNILLDDISLSEHVTYIETIIDVFPRLHFLKSMSEIIEILQLSFNSVSVRLKIRRHCVGLLTI